MSLPPDNLPPLAPSLTIKLPFLPRDEGSFSHRPRNPYGAYLYMCEYIRVYLPTGRWIDVKNRHMHACMHTDRYRYSWRSRHSAHHLGRVCMLKSPRVSAQCLSRPPRVSTSWVRIEYPGVQSRHSAALSDMHPQHLPSVEGLRVSDG